MSYLYPKPSKYVSRNVKVEVDLSKYATRADLKRVAGVDKLIQQQSFSLFKSLGG